MCVLKLGGIFGVTAVTSVTLGMRMSLDSRLRGNDRKDTGMTVLPCHPREGGDPGCFVTLSPKVDRLMFYIHKNIYTALEEYYENLLGLHFMF